MMKKIIAWLKKYRIHVFAWIAFILYDNIIVEILTAQHGSPLSYLTHYTIVIYAFYFHSNKTLPWVFRNKRSAIWKFPLTLIAELAVFISVYYIDDVALTSIHVHLMDGKPSISMVYFLFHAYRGMYYLGVSTSYYFVRNFIKESKRSDALEREKLNEVIKRQKIEQELTRAQNAFLKAQINPHFLFNTLDFIYHNVMELSPKAADAIITLSEMMRYAIDADKMGEFIYIGDELEQVQNLQYLNHLRKSSDIPLKVIYSDEVRNINFIPLVLLTLTENIFKHGSLQNGQEAIMELYIEDGSFVITTDNISNRMQQNTSHHTGLVNIEQRLKYAYGDDIYFHHHQDDDGHFRLTIKVPLRLLKGAAAPSPVLTGIGTI
jgi:sensor histidine kinase YesM